MESPQTPTMEYSTVSLFARDDLLGSLYQPAKSSQHASVSDGWGEGVLSSTKSEPPSPTSDYQGSSPFGSEWLDTRVDLLDYLAGPELEGLQHDDEFVVVSNDKLVLTDPTAHAVQVLKSIAEDQNALLEQEAKDSITVSSSAQQACRITAASPSEQLESSVEILQSDLLDLFPETLDENVVDPSSILTPMSPEDIDDILSSGPCSPDNTMDSSVESSFSDVGLSLGSLDSSNEVTDMHTVDLGEDLVQLLEQVQVPASPPVVISINAQSPQYFPETTQSPIYSPQYSPSINQSPVYSPEYSPPSSPEPSLSYRSKPYERPRKPGSKKGLPREVIQQERKMRKKQQNKDAATRYRQKKKEEQSLINDECDVLEARNSVLHDKVDSMTKEINYLKDLLAEVYAAKGLKLKLPISAS